MFKACVITISDRSYAGLREDASGPAVKGMLQAEGYEVAKILVLPDELAEIEAALKTAADNDRFPLIVTTGGTGFAFRDVTPEATLAVCDKQVPGIPEAMRAASMAITNRACLSRSSAGIRKQSLIINLPGSPKAATENLAVVLSAIAHGLSVLCGEVTDCGSHPNP